MSHGGSYKVFFQIITHKTFWRSIGTQIKRSHKDARARQSLLKLFLALSVLFLLASAVIVYLLFLLGTGSILFVPFVLPLIWWIRRGAKKEFAPMHITTIPSEPTDSPNEEDSQALRAWFSEWAIFLAVMVSRANSEHFLKEHKIPDGAEIITRRRNIDLLRSYGIFERMASADRDAILMPDGHWENASIDLLSVLFEPLRILRWILRVDFLLPELGQAFQGNLSPALQIVTTPELLNRKLPLMESEKLQIHRINHRAFYFRCLAELIHRGVFVTQSEKALQLSNEIIEAIGGQQDKDFLLGSLLVSEAETDQLVWVAKLARIRCQTLDWAITCLQEGVPAEPPQFSSSLFLEETATHPEPLDAQAPEAHS